MGTCRGSLQVLPVTRDWQLHSPVCLLQTLLMEPPTSQSQSVTRRRFTQLCTALKRRAKKENVGLMRIKSTHQYIRTNCRLVDCRCHRRTRSIREPPRTACRCTVHHQSRRRRFRPKRPPCCSCTLRSRAGCLRSGSRKVA